MTDLSSLPSAPECFLGLLPARLVDPNKKPALTALADYMALMRSIIDDPKMPPHLKPAYLTALEGTLTTQEGYVPLPKGVPPTVIPPGFALRRECDSRKISVNHARRIVQAYRQDLTKARYRDWSELLAYFRFSAGACADYAVEVLGLDDELASAVQALALAHALMARGEDAAGDLERVKKIYLPLRWLNDAGLNSEEISFDDRTRWLKVRDQAVAQIRQLLAQSMNIKAIKDWRLRLAFAWAKAGLAVRCDALSAAETFPVAALPPPSRTRQALTCLRMFLQKA